MTEKEDVVEKQDVEEQQVTLEETPEEAIEEETLEKEAPKEEAKEEEAKAEVKEEGKQLAREKEAKKKEEEIVEERIYTIPLGKAWIMPPRKRTPRAMRMIRAFVIKHMKIGAKKEGEEEEEPARLIISNEVNERVWGRGVEKPPRKIRIKAEKDKDGNVTVYLA